MSIYVAMVMGMVPFGSLLSGWIAYHLGVQKALIIGGGICVIDALWYMSQVSSVRSLIRPIYVQKGIIPSIEEIEEH